jgi:creatinine amidohydrolase
LLKSIWLNELTWEDVADYLKEDDIITFPIGSTEQHGPAGPLGVDSFNAISLAEDVAKRTNILSTPPLWFGDSSHHLEFPGTISLKTETLVAVVKDVIRSLARNGFKKFIIINGHRVTNNAAIITACRDIHENELPQVLLSLVDPMYVGKGAAYIKEDTTEHHAGVLEISHTWYKHPHLIKPEKLTPTGLEMDTLFSPFAHKDLFGNSGDRIEVFWNSKEQKVFTPTGSFSNSSKASPEKGRELHEYMVNNLVKFVEWLRNYDGPVGRL